MNFEPSKDVTIYDIARELNISAATVSRSLTDHYGTSEITKGKVLEKARQMGYSYNNFASNLRRKQSKVIGVIVPRLNSHFIAEAIAGIEQVVRQAGYTLMVAQSLEDMKNEISQAAVMSNNRVAGLLASLSGNTNSIEHFAQLAAKGLPVVLFDRIQKSDKLSCVCISNFESAYNLTTHLVEKGYQRIMHVTANICSNVYAERYRGFRQSLADHDLVFEENLLICNTLSEQDGQNVAQQVLDAALPPDAIFFANDNCAAHCMLALQSRGMQIPHDIAIAGFNNDPITRMVQPNLTTVDYNGYEIGTRSASVLLSAMGSSVVRPENIVLKSGVIIRQSS